MRVLYIATEYTGGMRPYALSLLKTLWNSDCFAIICIRNEDVKKDFKDLPPDNIYFINYPSGKFSRLIYHIIPLKVVYTINKLLSSYKIDLIQTLTGEFILSNYFRILQHKVKILHTVHDAISHDTKFNSVTGWINNKLFLEYPNHHLLKQAKYTITNSQIQLDYLRKIYPENNHYYSDFPTLITEQIKNGEREVTELKETKDYILFFGRVEFYKGLHLLYNIYVSEPNLRKRKLVIAGKGDPYFIKGKKNENVVILNRFIDDSEVKYLFQNAAIVIYPYISATQSGVLSIASFFGKKIIVSDIPYFNELVNKISLGIRIVNFKDKNVFIKNLMELLKANEDTYNFYCNHYEEKSLNKIVTEIQYKIIKRV